MATKLRNWTARLSVKICCLIIIPVLFFISLLGVIEIIKIDNISGNILFSDLEKNDYFFDNYIADAEVCVENLFYLQSEEHIRNMGCLKWQPSENTEYDENGNPIAVEGYDLVAVNSINSWYMGSIFTNNTDTLQAQQIVEEAINQQLAEYYYAKNRLQELPGLFYCATDGNRRIGNVPQDTKTEFFRSQPVYSISEPGKKYEYSRTGNYYHNYYNSYSHNYGDYRTNNLSSYVAFSKDTVDSQNSVWKTAQDQLERQLIVIMLPAVTILVLTVILMAGAGRKYGDESGKIHFTVIDKPLLDFSLCALAFYEMFLCYVIYAAIVTAWNYNNTNWVVALCAILSICFTLPLLGWVMSFAKHYKAGTWWRHTLVYTLTCGIFNKLQYLVISRWSGFSLTLRVILLGCCLFALCMLCSAINAWEFTLFFTFIVSALAVLGILKYTRKLFLVEQGAKEANNGKYDSPIQVTGGELGSIAASINNMASGMNTAVAERLKSERFKTELITNVSHDIRTPLTSLITYTDLLKNEGLDHERAPEYLEILMQKSARLKILTDDLFEASKALSGNIEAHVENLDLADFIRQVLGEVDEKLRESELDFRLNLPDHAIVQADGKLLWRVMENLLSNVFKYALKGSRVYIDIVPEGKWHRLDIKNISECPLNVEPSELIERFKRGDEARGGEGSGLGLSIAQSFVLAQGGQFNLSIDGDLFKASLHLLKAQ